MQLVNQEQEHIQLPHGTESLGHFAQPPDEFTRCGTVELKDREQLAQAARSHTGPMQGPGVAGFHAVQHAGKLVEAFAEEVVTAW
jgi:hypothetical protein